VALLEDMMTLLVNVGALLEDVVALLEEAVPISSCAEYKLANLTD